MVKMYSFGILVNVYICLTWQNFDRGNAIIQSVQGAVSDRKRQTTKKELHFISILY